MMDPEILLSAQDKFRELSEKFDGFISVILDNWRGYRFIYNVEMTACCRYGCVRCPLAVLLKDEKDGAFTARLLPAGKRDKRLFGPQNFLNCKSISQYQNCYTDFLVERCFTREEIFGELDLVKNMQIIYSRFGAEKNKETAFRQGVVRNAIALSGVRKAELIQEYVRLNPGFFGSH
ncbi:hypothetical protein A2454_04120 [Candidatus Peribacteria bacterium RIFOXYC2_FULL_55_14]|nr:MAG: hypothetical protein UY87_C0005G0006 [Candidatus Peribacteria bacterium GW2011_GWC2_54_8]KKW42868.1 MAG: hypothetical protein UY90_C0033G0005 [Candidatus Peregrinibacteria bacterium GW2011_GWA2_54_9]OGJ72238.1 MAG: hypothetical protein A2198_02320 [Candidatus Peribacteria bacterium RIFOXYA1_FULL_56_14]OGJ73607.1 MAG: hypothetical protein A2217_03900 [Candidatus Peribacteria bacterium RIFOXYA2_FULL_55_28]OGJ75811.1 MAG: hypothetical protein A2384_02455 [Candidatus Peribacteria bacterium 